MRFRNVCIESVSHILPPEAVTTDEIEQRLASVYERLRLPAGRIEWMTGIHERRFFPPGTLPGSISSQTVKLAVEKSGIDRHYIRALVHGSVCRDQMEPATATGVHAASGLPNPACIFDVSNACLGILNGMTLVANMIELGQIKAGVVVGTEVGRGLVEGTIDSLLSDEQLTRKTIKGAFASLTIGSGSAAVVLCDRRMSKTGHRLIGGAMLSDTDSHDLCAGGVSESNGDGRPRMETDSEALLHAGVSLAEKTWVEARRILDWQNEDVTRVFTHQVGRAHRKMMMEKVGLEPSLDYPTVEFLGNTGAAALPMAMSLGTTENPLVAGDRAALLGIGSGLNALMLGVEGA